MLYVCMTPLFAEVLQSRWCADPLCVSLSFLALVSPPHRRSALASSAPTVRSWGILHDLHDLTSCKMEN